MKLAIVGGGSTYTPELVDGFSRLREALPIEELWLIDPDPVRRELVGGVSRRMLAAAGNPAQVHVTDDLRAGVEDADAVMFQLRVGGQEARHGDETFPHEVCCIGQETTGPGGLAKALRTVPVVLDAAEVVRRHAKPGAWIIDFTNPVGIVTRALLEEGHRAVGLCNVAIGFQRRWAAKLGVDPSQVRLGHVGLNHLSWERSVFVTADGVETDLLPGILRDRLDEAAEDTHLDPRILELQQAMPSRYLQYYYAHDKVLREQLFAPTRAQQVRLTEQALLERYADPSVVTKPVELESRGGAYYSDAAVQVLASLTQDRGDIQVLNVRNDGTLPFLPDDHVIETPARVGADGPVALPVDPVRPDIAGLIAHVAGYERLALEAAVHGGRDRVVEALLAHPLIGQIDRAEKAADLLIAENAAHLSWAR